MKHFKIGALAVAIVLGLVLQPLFSLQAGSKSPDQKININTAQLDELQKLPRVGPAIAQRILDYRKDNGNFKRIEDLMKVRGIGEKVFGQLKDLITVGAEAGGK
jgi:comEA protein